MGRFVILVDEDIDPSDLRDVFWAITSRCDPATQTQVMHDFPTSDINPRVAPEDREAGRFVGSRIVIDACRPYRWLKEFPATNVMSPERKKQISEKWQSVLKNLKH
jgi:4-hydroxy-3-polyprenylbenzoate decarboxylase